MVNVIGAFAWLLGLFYAKGAASLPEGGILAGGDHRFAIGLMFGIVGLITLLWTNLRSTT